MAEVRSVEGGSSGLYATKAFDVGDVILSQELPLLVLSPPKENEEQLLSSFLKSKKSKDSNNACSIKVPSTVSEQYVGKFNGMIKAAVCFAANGSSSDAWQDLYFPSQDSTSAPEQDILHVAREALKYVEKHAIPDTSLHKLVSEQPDIVQKLMLVWSCNAFEGGKLYEGSMSRINHSCNPNAVIDGCAEEQQIVRASRRIDVGQEICISYLGLFLYADVQTRQLELVRTKHFYCRCVRCIEAPDVASAIPCPTCHKRHGRHLDENDQYDDEQTVRYAVPPAPTKQQTGIFKANSMVCEHCHETTSLPAGGNSSPSHVINLSRTVTDKVVASLRDRQVIQKQGPKDKDDMAVEAEWDEQLLQLASTVLGARHWTTNILLLLWLDRMLQAQHSAMLLTGAPPDLGEVAEAIDALERISRFVSGLSLDMHMGHLLSHVVIGVARTLVGLGDTKSKKYASEWLGKIDDYTVHFESEGMKKVVQTLQIAWENDNNDFEMEDQQEESDDRGDKKRAKTN